MAIIRIPRASLPSGDEGGDLDAILRSLAPVGSLARGAGALSGSTTLGNLGTGLSGLLGLGRGIAGGNPGQAVGGAANVGSGLAGLLDYPGVSSALGAVGGPLTFATGLASGDPLSSTLGGLQTASLASGYLGGPTLGGLASQGLSALYGMLPGATEAGAAALGLGGGAAAGAEGAALAGGGMAGGLAGGLALGPFALLAAGGLHAALSGGGDMFDSLFGEDRTQAVKQRDEYKHYADAWPGLVQRRTAGAKLFDTLGEEPDLEAALRTAGSGLHANTEPSAWNLSHQPSALPKLKPMDLSAWNAASPELGGHNAGAFLSLMDRGQAAGLDAGGLTGDWNLDQVNEGGVFKNGANLTGEDYRTRAPLTIEQMQAISRGDDTARAPMGQTQEAQDLGNAVAGIGRHLGVDWGSRGDGDFQNFDQDQLAGYGLTPGSYGVGALNYIRSYDPSVTANPEWERYAKALDPGNLLADLDPLTLTPRKKPEGLGYVAPDLSLGGF